MLDFNTFTTNQQAIYNSFRVFMRLAKVESMQIPPVDTGIKTGVLIAFDFGEKITSISSEVNRIVSGTAYSPLAPHLLHSTITVSKSKLSKDDLEVLQEICTEYKKYLPTIEVNFQEVLFNQDSVILAGHPNRSYWKFCQEFVTKLKLNTDMEFRLPKMSHITLARTSNTEEIAVNSKAVKEMLKKLANIPLPLQLSPVDIILRKFKHDSTGFDFTPLQGVLN